MAFGEVTSPTGDAARFVDRLDERLQTLLPEFGGSFIYGCDASAWVQPVDGHPDGDWGLDRFIAEYPDADTRALISVWGQWCLRASWPPLIVAALAMEVRPSVSALRMSLDHQGRPTGIQVFEDELISGPAATHLEALIREHTAPLMERVAARGGFAPKVLWNVAGAMLDWTLARLRDRGAVFPLDPAINLFNQEALPGLDGNPLRGTRREASHGRRVCCLRYRLDGMPYCGDCPIATPPTP